MVELFEEDLLHCLQVLREGGIILYPTDTVWGIGCDATNAEAVQKIFQLKERAESKAMIVLLGDERDILQYVAAPDPTVGDFIAAQAQPTTIIFEGAVGLPNNLVGEDGTVALRVVREPFCRHLVKRLRKPLVSTSANKSGAPTPRLFREISPEIMQGVDYLVRYRQDDETPGTPSRLVAWSEDGNHRILR